MKLIKDKIKYFLAVVVCLTAAAMAGLTQTPPRETPRPEPAPKVKDKLLKAPLLPPAPERAGGVNSERSIVVDPKVNISLCVTQGDVKINGWSRNEVRVFVKDGGKVAFKVLQKSSRTENPVWIMITGSEPAKVKPGSVNECTWGSEIEMDVPEGASVNLKGRETRTAIDSVRKVNVKTVGGDISARNISEGVIALTYEGDVTIENSQGTISLESSTGNIVAFGAGPNEIGDVFKAKTNSGAISMQRLGYRQTEVNSISGSVFFNGEILGGGSYTLGTTNGSIRLSLPLSTSCRFTASYNGIFTSDVPFTTHTENISEGPVKSIVGVLGTGGDATLNLTSNNGSISIKKH